MNEVTELLGNHDMLLKEVSLDEMIPAPMFITPSTAPLTVMSASDILQADYPEMLWIIPDILPIGLSVLAGKSKVGKSWLCLQMLRAVVTGGEFFGRKVEQGPVLYLSLEDTGRRLKSRMIKQGWSDQQEAAHFMTASTFENEIGDLAGGGSERLAVQIRREGYRLVLIDTLSRAIEGDQSASETMTAALYPLSEIANEAGMAIGLVDHLRKGANAETPFDALDEVRGSTAKVASADTVLGLYRHQGQAGARLFVVGRDVNEATFNLQFDRATGYWQCEGDNEESLTPAEKAMVTVVADLGPITLSGLVSATKKDKGYLYRTLQDLVNANALTVKGNGRGATYSVSS